MVGQRSERNKQLAIANQLSDSKLPVIFGFVDEVSAFVLKT